MAASISWFLARRRPAVFFSAFVPDRRPRLAPRHVLLVLAAGAVLIGWSRARHRSGEITARRAAVRPGPSPARPRQDPRPVLQPGAERLQPGAEPLQPRAESLQPRAVSGEPSIPRPRVERVVVLPPSTPTAGSTELASSWVQRAALAVHLGQPAALRRIAEEMEWVGREIEAGLLKNYALLLERSKVSRGRVLTEVTRMLQAATGHRRSALTAAAGRSTTGPAAAEPAPRLPDRPTPAPAHAQPAAWQPTAAARVPDLSTRRIVPMPVLPIGARRRAAR